jgi:hypothetical protein
VAVTVVFLLAIGFIPTVSHAVVFAYFWSRTESLAAATVYHTAYDGLRDFLSTTVGLGPIAAVWSGSLLIIVGPSCIGGTSGVGRQDEPVLLEIAIGNVRDQFPRCYPTLILEQAAEGHRRGADGCAQAGRVQPDALSRQGRALVLQEAQDGLVGCLGGFRATVLCRVDRIAVRDDSRS